MRVFRRWSGTTYYGWSVDLWSLSIMFRAERGGPARQLFLTWGYGAGRPGIVRDP